MTAPKLWSRRRFVAALSTGAAMVSIARPARAASRVTVPIPLQAELFAKVANYDRGLPERARAGVAHVVIVEHPRHAGSLAAAGQLRHGLSSIDAIAGLRVEVSTLRFDSPEQVVATCRDRRAAVLYFTPGLVEHTPVIAGLLHGTSMLTASLVPDDIEHGAVLGFDLEEGKPRVLVNLRLARAHNVKLKSSLLKLATIVER